MFERWRTRRHIRIALSSDEELDRRRKSIKALSELPVSEASVQALVKIQRREEFYYQLRSDALSALQHWSAKTAIGTAGLCQVIEDDKGHKSFYAFEASDFRGDVKAAIESHLRIARRTLNSSEPVWDAYFSSSSPYDKLVFLLKRLKELGASQSQLADLRKALPRLRTARVPVLAEYILKSDYFDGTVRAIRELGEIATPATHIALVKFWRTCSDRIYESKREETVPDYNDSSGFASATRIERRAASEIRDELEGAARASCDAAKLQADRERGLK